MPEATIELRMAPGERADGIQYAGVGAAYSLVRAGTAAEAWAATEAVVAWWEEHEPVGLTGARRVAVLSKKDLAGHRYDEWLAPHGCAVELFAETDPATEAVLAGPHHFTGAQLFPGWKRNRAVDAAVLAAHRERPFEAIVALSECDQVRAAELRERLGVPGESVTSATAYRDKLAMKEHARRGGVPLPVHAPVRTVADLVDLAAAYPAVVVKPVDGSGATGVAVLAGPAAALACAGRQPLDCDADPRLLVEEYLPAPMLSVDGVLAHDRVVTATVGAYTRTCLDTLCALEPQGILGLDLDDPRRPAALAATERVVAALPPTDLPTSFHCELFDDPERGLLLCEIACRTGGGRLRRTVRATLGVDLERAACLGQAGGAGRPGGSGRRSPVRRCADARDRPAPPYGPVLPAARGGRAGGAGAARAGDQAFRERGRGRPGRGRPHRAAGGIRAGGAMVGGRALPGLSRPPAVPLRFVTGAGVSSLGTGLFAACATLFFVGRVGFSAPAVGAALSAGAAVGLMAAPCVGLLADRLGVRPVLTGLLLLRGLAYGGLAAAHGIPSTRYWSSSGWPATRPPRRCSRRWWARWPVRTGGPRRRACCARSGTSG